MDLTISNVTATAAQANFANRLAGRNIQIQYATRPDFKLCVAPIISLGSSPASVSHSGFNQATTYYARAREVVIATGVEEAWTPVQAFRTSLSSAQSTTPAAVMIEPAMLVTPEPVLEWVGDNEQAGFPAENLGYDAPVAWRSQHASTHAFNLRIGGAAIDTVALLMSNAPEAATCNVIGATSQANLTASPSFSNAGSFRASANLPGRPGYHALIRLPSLQSYPWWRVVISAAPPGGLFHLEHAVIGRNRTTKNHSVDKSEAGMDLGTLERSRSGMPLRSLGHRMRRVDFDLSMLTEAEYETNYADLDWRVGATEPVLCVPNTKANAFLHDRILYGAIRGGKVVNPASPRYTRGFSIESLV